MADTTENDLRAAVKALSDVVAPAIDPGDPLAAEQLRLVVESLEFLRNRLQLLGSRERFELAHHARMAGALRAHAADVSADFAATLDAALGLAARLLSGGPASSANLVQASAVLAACARVIIRHAAAWPAERRRDVEAIVLDASDERLAFERSWFIPYGFDPTPAAIPGIEAVIAGNAGG